MDKAKIPTYGTSLHYSGDSGAKYLEWQDAKGKISGEIESRKLKDFNFADCSILDFGSGTGNLLANLMAFKKIAVEINLHAHPKLKSQGLTVYETIEEVETGTVDYVISNHSLEHVPFPIEALKQMKRVLKQGGQLILIVPIDDWRTQKIYNPLDINHHLNTWNPQILGNTLTEAGFKVTAANIKILTHAWFPFFEKFYRFPLFDFMCKIWAIARKRRQIIATVSKF
jgi:SAM-dependent methyltransferase